MPILCVRYICHERCNDTVIGGCVYIFLVEFAIFVNVSRLTLNDGEMKIESLDECIPPLASVSGILHNCEQ
jgi:hypothetical protein